MIDKEIIVFDLETTGLDKGKDHIIQFAGIKVDPQTYEIIDTLNLKIRPTGNYQITLGAYFKHHISPSDLEGCPIFEEVAYKIEKFFKGDNVILTYNGLSFDLNFLATEFARIGKTFTLIDKPCYDAFLEEKRINDLTLEGRFKHYYDKDMSECGLSAHDALSDVKATLMIFQKQQEQKPYGPEEVLTECNTIKMMDFMNEGKVPCFTIGKYRSVPIKIAYRLDPQYFGWILSDKCHFSPSCKKYVKEFIEANS